MEHKVYVLWIQNDYSRQPLKPFKDSKQFFFFAFCKFPIIELRENSAILEVNIKTFMTSWKYAMHYWTTHWNLNEGKYGFCDHVKDIIGIALETGLFFGM